MKGRTEPGAVIRNRRYNYILSGEILWEETQDFTEPEPVFLEEPIPIPEPVSPEPVSPIEPANIPKPAVEETSPLPNMADPGHVMTPEEIASLLANM